MMMQFWQFVQTSTTQHNPHLNSDNLLLHQLNEATDATKAVELAADTRNFIRFEVILRSVSSL